MAEVTARTSVPSDEWVESNRLNRIVDALRNQEAFTREQVAWLMSQAMRWGYENRDAEDRGYWAGYWTRVAEENSEWPDDTVLFKSKDTIRGINQRTYRAKCDAAADLPRPCDHHGGPVEWDKPDDIRIAA